MSSSENTAFHALSPEETADILKTDAKAGLHPAEAAARLKKYGKNKLEKKKKKGILKIFKNNIFDGVTATFDNIFDVLDEDKVPAAPATNDEDEEDTEEKA